MLHAPDFLGYESAIHMAKDHRDIVQRGLQLKKAGNQVVSLLGGREIHPINVRVGGFYKVPSKSELAPLAERLEWARDAALETVRWVAAFPFPDFEQDYEFVALNHPDEYPFNEGRIVSNKGLDIDVQDYDANFVEEHVQWSNALHSTIKGRGAYFCGPMARFNLNFEKLRPIAKQAAAEAGIAGVVPQSIQEHHCSLRSKCSTPAMKRWRSSTVTNCPDCPALEVQPRAGIGYGCTEAPRGILYHRYRIDDQGVILDAKIVPPTSQNQKTIEGDLWRFVPPRIDLPNDKLTWQCEQAIRNYDPCISCATHFLNLKVERD